MGEKISTIVLKVDLECQRCYKKIRRVLCKIQDKMNIKTISFDEKSNSVTISGPFEADKVCKKLCCQAGRVIKEMDVVKGKDGGGGGGDKAAAKPAEKDAGKPEKPKEGKADNKEGKAEKDGGGKADKPAEKKEAKAEAKDAQPAEKEKPKNAKPEKKVRFEGDDASPAKAVPKADIGPLLEKIVAANKGAGPEPQPVAPPPAAPPVAQGLAVPSIWPAPVSSVAGYSYSPSYDPSSYYGGGYGGGYGYGCNCGYAPGYCRCGGKPATPPGGYYGVPVYDNQGWHYGGRQSYYPHQQPQQACYEDPNAGCSVM